MKKVTNSNKARGNAVHVDPAGNLLQRRRKNSGRRTGATAVCIYCREVCNALKNKSQIRWTCSVCRGKGQRY